MENLGELFRELRESRNLSMKSVVGTEMSIAQLSKFERGESEITLSKFYFIIERIGITIEEFELVAQGYKLNQFFQVFQELSSLYMQKK
ncbi:Helix-turn-helix domain-containing protein [Pilibacter termitis]|uniref:Helix-turn-helix domain-containing protein n=1 Tax=Pilibacter termitis TaxID=263852 RepID=A0A1T4LK84_9ENTE|nr:helix-turn-helix transcriptional regulator [Pilibacter termitis]SJZ55046.1 Helix-turn-helix domain-containing protein [Pilibacter termitis]